MRFFMWLWSFLPDRCEVPGCRRQGLRGNENIISGIRMCDHCHVDWMKRHDLMPRRDVDLRRWQ